MYWMSTITGVGIGKKQYALSAEASIILDSGTSLAYMPKADGKKIIKKILKGTGFNFKLFGTYFVNCDTSKYSSFYILMDSYWIEIPPEAYVFDLGGTFCMLGFGLMDIYGDYLFGDVLLRSYYTVWDNDNSLVGFSPRTDSYAGSITAGTTPKKNL
jgi:saccharopepsin